MTDPNQGVLPIDPDDLRHPMWAGPRIENWEGAPEWQVECLREITARLKPFDGRPNSEIIVTFCRHVWDVTTGWQGGLVLLVGTIAMLKAKWVRGMVEQADATPLMQVKFRTDATVISKLGDDFIAAIEAAQ